jgi:predicted nucleotidyltransferase
LSTAYETYIKHGKRALEHLGNYREVSKRVKKMVRESWKDAEVYVFGSVVEGRVTAGSDIDILVVADGVTREDAIKMRARVAKDTDAPIELHVASRKEYENWYRRFAGRLEEVP